MAERIRDRGSQSVAEVVSPLDLRLAGASVPSFILKGMYMKKGVD